MSISALYLTLFFIVDREGVGELGFGSRALSIFVTSLQTVDPVSEIVPSSAIRVFLVMENRLLREALIRLLRKRSDVVVIGYEGPVPTACEVRDT